MIAISFIVPSYNVEEYIERCVNSLLEQTIKNIEIICIDDASSDGTNNKLLELKKKDDRIKTIVHEKNVGQAISRNDGIMQAKGEYIAFVDADDYVDKAAYEKIYDVACKKQVEICYFNYEDVYEEDVIYRKNGKILGEYNKVYNGEEILKEFIDNNDFFLFPWSALYKKDFIKKNKLYFNSLRVGESGEFMLRCLNLANRVTVQHITAYYYYQRRSSIMHSDEARDELLFGQIYQYITALRLSLKTDKNVGLDAFLNYQEGKIHGGLQVASYEKKKKIQDRLKDLFSQKVFNLLCNQNNSYPIKISEKDIEKICKTGKIIIYGAGYITPDLIKYLNGYDVEIKGIAVSKKKNNPNTIYGHRVYEICEFKKISSEVVVIVAANSKYYEGIKEKLDMYNFENVLYLNITL